MNKFSCNVPTGAIKRYHGRKKSTTQGTFIQNQKKQKGDTNSGAA